MRIVRGIRRGECRPFRGLKERREWMAGKKEEVDDPHTSAAKQKRPLRIGAELLLAERPSCSCVAACIRHYFPRQGRRLEPRWRASREFHPSEVLSKLHTGVTSHSCCVQPDASVPVFIFEMMSERKLSAFPALRSFFWSSSAHSSSQTTSHRCNDSKALFRNRCSSAPYRLPAQNRSRCPRRTRWAAD